MVMLTNSFLARILSFFSDRMHWIHPHGVVIYLLSAFDLINNSGVIFRSDYGGFIYWWELLSMGIASQLYILWYGYDTFCMYGVEVWAAPSFLLCFLFVSLATDPAPELTLCDAAAFPSLKVCTTDTVMEQTHQCCISSSSWHVITASPIIHHFLF